MATKTCPINRVEFQAKAVPVKVTLEYTGVDGLVYTKSVYINPRTFSTSSMGWGVDPMAAKVTMTLDGRDVPCQLGLNLTVIGSKELPA